MINGVSIWQRTHEYAGEHLSRWTKGCREKKGPITNREWGGRSINEKQNRTNLMTTDSRLTVSPQEAKVRTTGPSLFKWDKKAEGGKLNSIGKGRNQVKVDYQV